MAGIVKHADVGDQLSKAEWLAATTHVFPGGSPGSLVWWDGSDFVEVVPGSVGQILYSNGAGAPAFANPGSAPLARPLRAVSASGNVLINDGLLLIDTTSGVLTFTLPNPAGMTLGHVFGFKKIASVANQNLVTILPFGTEKIENDTSLTFDLPGTEVDIIFDGTNYHITGAL